MTLHRRRRGPLFWVVVAVTTVFISLEPGFFLVVLAVGLSALTATWIMMLVRLLVLDAWARRSKRSD
ncbi:MAG: hypothetical protein HY270_13675 [Deltaproteobacteria bacterium]|nr:hypothetical protein [Deltaproteobacteria bacterium]